ncbi:hypothetical protein QR680_006946 [Steinernema hermaphroditum]|uniref:1-phosphatidylinositol 4,5-bisphosphate phosphodiesterase n=1 Tax=Steinernema hermaphroditum TaxID=289476 RepID=A0AA39HZK6_9BILA|nr:hypothetical protein QR680_006946 [Steinernema hermaphroditum]
MAKEYQFNWRSQIPTTFVKGTAFDRYDDESTCLELGALFRVDEYGFFLHWQIDGRDAVVLDLAAIWEARPCSAPPKDGRILFELEQRGPRETLEERTTWITHGQDLVNVSSFYIVAHDVETAREWRNGLNELLKNHKMRHLCPTTCLQKHWRYLCLSLNDRHKIPIRNIVKTFSSGKPEKMVHKCLSDLGLAGDKYVVTIRRTWQRNIRNLVKCSTARKQKEREELDVELFTFEKFLRLYHKICPRTDVQELFVKLSGQKEYLTRDRLINFLNDEQRDPRLNEILFPFFDNDRVQQLIAKYEIDENYIANGKMSGDAFLRFLMSDENAPVFLDRIELFMDMEQPLCHYYINSSHNTYLTGRQYGGKSSTEIYRQVLLSGCRCIELDCWDGTGENKGEPIITHGKAMCTDVFFKEVLYQIRDTAFARSDYPVILSFENHCSKSNQLKMAKYCMDIFGDMLLSKPFDDFPLEPGVPLPSPNRLKRKILIKNKRLKADIEKHQMEQFLREGKLDEEDEVTETPEVVGEDTVVPPDLPGKEMDEAHPELKQTNFISKLKPLGFAKKPQPTLTKEEEERIFAEYHYTGATTNIHPLLSTLVNYTHPVKFSGFDVAEMNNLYFHMSSFSESTGLGYLKQNAPEFVNYNKRQLSRIYPKGARVDSSNFLPQIFWNAGCQMVSLNFQTPDVCMQLNQGKFEYNGFCGYLLKPDFMRRPDRNFDPFSESPVDGVIAAHCSVRVISGQFLCDRKVGTYVEVEMYGLPTDTIRKEHRTRMIPANGLNPVYNEEPFVFRKVVLPELAVLRFAVYDENGKQLGQRILPLDGLQAGFRHISLRTESNSPTVLPTLFVHLGLKTYVPDELSGLVDALADPRAYLSQQEKLKEALHNMGVDDADIVEVPQNKNGSAKGASAVAKTVVPGIKSLKINGSSTAGPHDSNAATPSVPQKDQPNSAKSNAEGAESKFKIEAIDVQELKKDKAFIKLSKKFQKDIDDMKKRHQKQRDACQKQQQTNIDKLMCDSQKSSKKKHSHGNNSAPNTSRHSSLSGRLSNSGGISDMSNNYKMRSLVSNQTDEWSSLIRRQEAEEFEQKKTHIKEELDVLRKLMTEAQKQQLIALKQKLENEGRELKQMQTKKSMDDTKIIQQDKTIKTKAEKDRRVKELNEKNVKMFVEERKRLAMKAEKHEEQLTKRHQDQNEQLEKDYAKVLEQEEMNYRESLLASRPESVV